MKKVFVLLMLAMLLFVGCQSKMSFKQTGMPKALLPVPGNTITGVKNYVDIKTQAVTNGKTWYYTGGFRSNVDDYTTCDSYFGVACNDHGEIKTAISVKAYILPAGTSNAIDYYGSTDAEDLKTTMLSYAHLGNLELFGDYDFYWLNPDTYDEHFFWDMKNGYTFKIVYFINDLKIAYYVIAPE